MVNFSKYMDRRSAVAKLAATAGFLGLAPSLPALHHAASRGKRMGIVIHSYGFRGSRNQSSKRYPPFKDAVELLQHVHAYGAGGVQTRTSDWNQQMAHRIRSSCEELSLFIEGTVSAPRSEADRDRFEAEIALAKEAGVKVFRTAMGGRRYEDFDNRQGWLELKKKSWERIRLAEPIVRKHRVRLAVENHKDWEADDLIEFMEGMSSEYLGVTIDTGNSISLLEHPDETAQRLAKYGATTHIKDMGVQEYEDGFLLSEVPVGQGFLNMKSIFDVLENENPQIQFCLEMITRNPLKVPCKTKAYWQTFETRDANKLANAFKWIRANEQADLPSVEGKTLDERIEYEEQNNHLSVKYAEKALGLRG